MVLTSWIAGSSVKQIFFFKQPAGYDLFVIAKMYICINRCDSIFSLSLSLSLCLIVSYWNVHTYTPNVGKSFHVWEKYNLEPLFVASIVGKWCCHVSLFGWSHFFSSIAFDLHKQQISLNKLKLSTMCLCLDCLCLVQGTLSLSLSSSYLSLVVNLLHPKKKSFR